MRKLSIFLAIPLLFAACGEDASEFDSALLDEYRSAIPKESQLSASSPQASSTRAVGDPAMYPHAAGPMAMGINGAIKGIVDLMKNIVDHEPTFYNSETEEFLWGPWEQDNDFGTVLAYIAKQPEGSDFEYVYALLRGADNNLATMVPVIWGAANPDPDNEENGAGITLWDFEANYAFAEANDPDFATKVFDRGRFVAVYGAGPDDNDPDARMAFAYAVFNDFVPQDEPGNTPADLDYLYGRYEGSDGVTLDFIDFDLGIDVHEDGVNTLAEDVSIRMAFVNSGWGRAEASAVNGELAADERVDVVECWDDALGRQYLDFTFTNATSSTSSTEPAGGTVDLCVLPDGEGNMVPVFANSLTDLGIPGLDDVDQGMRDALWCVAENGMSDQCD